MSALRDLVTRLGLSEGQTLLQSGNLVFAAERRSPADLERLLEREAEKRLGLATNTFVRSEKDWRELVAGNPYLDAAKQDPGHLVVMLLKDRPSVKAVRELEDAIVGRETVRVTGRHGYIVYPDGIGRSKLTNALIERKLETRGTGRNWNTVLKLAAVLQSGVGSHNQCPSRYPTGSTPARSSN
jgi:uncharacterized protein (DUF1697 family)